MKSVQDWPFRIVVYTNVDNIYFAHIFYGEEKFDIRFKLKDKEKILEYLRKWHWMLQHDREYVCCLKHRAKVNERLFYR